MNAPMTSSTCSPSIWLTEHPKLGISLMDHLFNRLDGAYPNRWRAAFASEQAVANWRESWAEAFDEEGLAPQLIADGLKACRKLYDWPPSITEFLKACKPPINIDVAIYEAINQMRARQHGKDVWSNPAIYWAAVEVGEYDMISQTFSQIKPRFEAALDKVMAGAVLPVPARAAALSAPGKSESTREYGRQRLAEIGALAALKPPLKVSTSAGHGRLLKRKSGQERYRFTNSTSRARRFLMRPERRLHKWALQNGPKRKTPRYARTGGIIGMPSRSGRI